MEQFPEPSNDTSPEQREQLRIQSIVIPANEDEPLRPGEIHADNLDAYQQAVNGYIEHIALKDPPSSMYVNDEGKLRDLPTNRRATLLLWMHNPAFRYGDVIAGNVMVTGPADSHGYNTSVSPDLLHRLLEAKSFRAEVKVYGEENWHGNERRFTDWTDAYSYVLGLGHRWTSVEDVRVVPEASD